MSNAAQFNIANAEEAQEAARYAAQHGKGGGTMPAQSGPSVMVASQHEVVWKDGEMTSSAHHKTQEAATYTIPSKARPGFVSIPGYGETPIEAAKASGLLPEGWQPGDPSPFVDPADSPMKAEAGTGTEQAKEAGSASKDAKGKADDAETSAAQHKAKVASEVLQSCDSTHGPEAADAMLSRAAETGELPVDMLPEGFTEAQMQQVHAGYVAQADAALATVHASVALLEDTLTDDELMQARMATVHNSTEELAALGQRAVARLAQLPKTDPEGFAQMVNDMDPAEREYIRYDEQRRDWIVQVPGLPPMSYGAAVHNGLVRV